MTDSSISAVNSATLSTVNYKFNGANGFFTLDNKESGDSLSSLSLFAIIRIKRQYVLEDISKKEMGKPNGPLYFSPIIEDDASLRFSLYNNGELFEGEGGQSQFLPSELRSLASKNSNFKFNGKIVIYGIYGGKPCSINCSDGNYSTVVNFIKRSTTNCLFPYCNISSETKISPQRLYYALSIAHASTGKIPVTKAEAIQANKSIQDSISKHNLSLQYTDGSLKKEMERFDTRVAAFLDSEETNIDKTLESPLPLNNIVPKRGIESLFPSDEEYDPGIFEQE